MMFGLEPVLPGWQRFQQDKEFNQRNNRLAETRYRQATRALLMAQKPTVSVGNISVGDYCVYPLSDYERRERTSLEGNESSTLKFGPKIVITLQGGAGESRSCSPQALRSRRA